LNKFNSIFIAIFYNEAEIIIQEDKFKLQKSKIEQYNETISNLTIVNKHMVKSPLKHEMESAKIRAQYLNSQTVRLKNDYKKEVDDYRLKEHEYNKSHIEYININGFYRNASIYVQEKKSELKHASTKTIFPSFGQESHMKSEHMNIQKNVKKASDNLAFDENKLNRVKSYDKLANQKNFFKQRKSK
jgi:hypothetical protein